MSENKWIELEYKSLREDIKMLADAAKDIVKFCVPGAAAVYAVPALLHQTSQTFLWSVCAGLAGLLLTAMVQTFCSCLNGAWRIGTYIKEVIEPQTGGGLRWETVLYEWEQRTLIHTESAILVVSIGTLLANVAAAAGAGAVFLESPQSMVPAAIAMVFALLCVPAAWRTSRAAKQRQQYSQQLKEIVDMPAVHGSVGRHT